MSVDFSSSASSLAFVTAGDGVSLTLGGVDGRGSSCSFSAPTETPVGITVEIEVDDSEGDNEDSEELDCNGMTS